MQLIGLEKRFENQKYLSTPDRILLADSLGLSQLQVKTWYQNRRMKWKKKVLKDGCRHPPTKPKGRPKKNSIPSFSEIIKAAAEAASNNNNQSIGSSSASDMSSFNKNSNESDDDDDDDDDCNECMEECESYDFSSDDDEDDDDGEEEGDEENYDSEEARYANKSQKAFAEEHFSQNNSSNHSQLKA